MCRRCASPKHHYGTMVFATVTTDWIVAICAIIALPALAIQTIASWNAVRRPATSAEVAPIPKAMPKKNSVLPLFFDTEAMPFSLFLGVSAWQLARALSDMSPITRLSVLWICLLTSIALICLCYLVSRVVMYLLISRWRRKEGLDP